MGGGGGGMRNGKCSVTGEDDTKQNKAVPIIVGLQSSFVVFFPLSVCCLYIDQEILGDSQQAALQEFKSKKEIILQ